MEAPVPDDTPYEMARKQLRWLTAKGYIVGYDPVGNGSGWRRFVVRLNNGTEKHYSVHGALAFAAGIRIGRRIGHEDALVAVVELEFLAAELDQACGALLERGRVDKVPNAAQAADRARAVAAEWRSRTDTPRSPAHN